MRCETFGFLGDHHELGVLDVLADLDPFADASSVALGLAEEGSLEGFVAAHTVTPLQHLFERDVGRAGARRARSAQLGFLQVEPVDGPRLRHALALGWKDFEDAVQAVCAETARADYLLSRDVAGFKQSTVRTVAPAELVVLV